MAFSSALADHRIHWSFCIVIPRKREWCVKRCSDDKIGIHGIVEAGSVKRGAVDCPVRPAHLDVAAAHRGRLTYLQLRASRYGICYPTIEEIVHEPGLTSRKR